MINVGPERHTFTFPVPLLRGPHCFSFRYEYDYYDFAETGRRGRRLIGADTSAWSYFEDLVALPCFELNVTLSARMFL